MCENARLGGLWDVPRIHIIKQARHKTILSENPRSKRSGDLEREKIQTDRNHEEGDRLIGLIVL